MTKEIITEETEKSLSSFPFVDKQKSAKISKKLQKKKAISWAKTKRLIPRGKKAFSK